MQKIRKIHLPETLPDDQDEIHYTVNFPIRLESIHEMRKSHFGRVEFVIFGFLSMYINQGYVEEPADARQHKVTLYPACGYKSKSSVHVKVGLKELDWIARTAGRTHWAESPS
jgi:hypothetical protein